MPRCTSRGIDFEFDGRRFGRAGNRDRQPDAQARDWRPADAMPAKRFSIS
jgi:hypothetical protein